MNVMSNTVKRLLNLENMLGILAGVCLVGVSIVAIHTLHRGSSRGNTSVVHFEPPSFDFGRVFQGETLKHEFKLANGSTNAIQVVAVRSSCQCTIIEKGLPGKTIVGLGFLLVPVEFHSGSQTGPGNANVEALLENHGVRYYARAFITANVNADFTFEPRSLNFGTMKVGESATRVIKLTPRASGNLTINQPQSTDILKMSLRTNAADSSAKPFALLVTFEAPGVRFSQTFKQTIMVQTSSKRIPCLSIPVSAVIRPELEITPDMIVLQGQASGESRFTIHTLQASRVVRAVVTRNNVGVEILPTVDVSSSEETWDLTHIRQVANASIAGAERIDFELTVRNGAGRTEARSVSVPIKSL
jgi:hypothetical protein